MSSMSNQEFKMYFKEGNADSDDILNSVQQKLKSLSDKYVDIYNQFKRKEDQYYRTEEENQNLRMNAKREGSFLLAKQTVTSIE